MPELSPQPNIDPQDHSLELTGRYWLIIIATGALAGLAGGGLMRLLFLVEHLAWHYHAGEHFLQGVSASTDLRRVLNLLLAGLLAGGVGALLKRIFGKAGSDVEGAIWLRQGHVPFIATMSKALLAIVTVGLGTSLGRESPIKQAGGAIAALVGRWARLSPAQQKLLVASGVGAGMASAYNVPLGGGLFAVEVLIGSVTLQRVLPALTASVVATAASWLLLPATAVYNVPEYPLTFATAGWAVLAGPLFGLAAVMIVRATAWSESVQLRGWPAVVVPVTVLGALGAVAIRYPELLGNGKDTVQLAFSNQFAIGTMLILAALKLLATASCLGAGARGGLFTPTMTVGALLGGALGHLWSMLLPGAAPGSYAVIGSCAVLAAATRGPISSLVLIVELTRHADVVMVPLVLASAAATCVAGQFEPRSIYSARAARQ